MSPAASPHYVSCPRCTQVVAKPAVGNPTCPACGYPGPDRRAAAPAVPPWTQVPPTQPAAVRYDNFGNPLPQTPPQTGMATAGLVLGIVGLLFPLAGIVGIILSAIAKKNGQPNAKRSLVVAIVCTAIGLVAGILLQLFILRSAS